MRTSDSVHRSARTFLTHFFGRGLDEARYVVERYKSDFESQIRPCGPGKGSKARRKEAQKVMTGLADRACRTRRAQQFEPVANAQDDVALRACGVEEGRARHTGAVRALRSGEAGRVVDG